MSQVTFYEGKKGTKGQTGLIGVDVEDVRGSLLDNPLVSLFHQNKISETVNPDWSRVDQASIADRYGNLTFVGGDTISNLLSYSEDFSQWSDSGGYWTITDSAISDPLGGNGARRIKLDLDTFPSGVNVMGINYTTTTATQHTFSVWIRSVVGTVENVGIQLTTGGSVTTLSDTVTTDWQRISITVNVFTPTTNSFYINVYGLTNVEFDIFGAQFEVNDQPGEYTKTTGAPVDGPNPEKRWRANNSGYVIESEKENIALFSQNLLGAAWDVSGGNISAYTGQDPVGSTNSNIQVNFDTPNVVLSQDLTITQGEQYSLSMFVYIAQGSIDSIIGSVGGGVTSAFNIESLGGGGFVRISELLTAGSSDSFSITLTSSDLTTEAIVFGVQLETGSISTYIKTIDASASRSPDIVKLPYDGNFPLPSEPWTLIFSRALLTDVGDNRYLFHNGLSGAGEFSAFFSENSFTINSGTDIYAFNFSGSNYEVIYDGVNVSLYSNATLISSIASTVPSTQVGVEMFLGCDDLEQNQLNAFLSGFYFYNEALTVNELRYIRGSDHGDNS